jgi:predicted NAD/FAD-binding protein
MRLLKRWSKMGDKKIAIIGTGISGLTCGYYLSKKDYDITIFEAADYIGGHTNTAEFEFDEETERIDTGFIVFNNRTYPNFIKLLAEIDVPYQPSEMSFSVRNDHLNLEYNGSNFNTLFAQRANLLRPAFWKMLGDIARFNKDVRTAGQDDQDLTIGQYLQKSHYSELFRDNYLLPMISAIWSMGLECCLDFPLAFFVRFFENHGLLDITNRPQWYTIKGGSSSYIDPLIAGFRNRIQLNTPIRQISRSSDGVIVDTGTVQQRFDHVILACHADEALGMLKEATAEEQRVLGAFEFSKNRVVLHTDISQLPKRPAAWASWNYRVIDSAREQTALTYNMNILQRLKSKNTYLVTLNQDIEDKYVIRRYVYNHPVYTTAMLAAQSQWQAISGIDRIHYCGAYWFNGFHEDGVKSGLRVCDMMEER